MTALADLPRLHDGGDTVIWTAGDVEAHAIVRRWIVRAPRMHPAWSYYLATLVHLRYMPGAPPAIRQFDAATHEFAVFVLAAQSDEDVDDERLSIYRGANVAQQFAAASDAEALRRVERCLSLVAEQRLSLDQDFRREWRHLLVECPDIVGHGADS